MRTLVFYIFLACSQQIAADCSTFEDLARHVAEERQKGNRVHIESKSRMVTDMLNSAFHYPGYFGKAKQQQTINRFVNDWARACKLGRYNQ